MNDDTEIDYEGLAAARWLRAYHAVSEALDATTAWGKTQLTLALEMELGLRSVLDVARAREEPISIAELLQLLREFAEANTEHLHLVVPRLERALARLPEAWVNYVNETGRACFDPAELAGCCAIAKDAAEFNAPVHKAINALMTWSIDSVVGQRPIPEVRFARQHEHPTIILDVVREIGKIELNWDSLGLVPVINRAMVIRWDANERWTAFVKLASPHAGTISRSKALRIRSDGQWVIIKT